MKKVSQFKAENYFLCDVRLNSIDCADYCGYVLWQHPFYE